MTAEQKSTLHAMTTAAGLTMAEFVRRALLDEDASLLVDEFDRRLEDLGIEKLLDEIAHQRKVLEAQDNAMGAVGSETAVENTACDSLH
ncbi:MAG TPA: hypothetical protein VFG43_05060 [Geminicoccaceae bacterium]|nr:hypothetical protein [Geminicoccaceae bacterium]